MELDMVAQNNLLTNQGLPVNYTPNPSIKRDALKRAPYVKR